MSASGWACDGPRALWGTFRGPGTVFRARDPPLDGGPPARQSMGRRRSARLVCAGRCRRCCCSGPRESLLSVHLGLTDYCSSIPAHRGPGISATGTTLGPGVAREAPGTLCPPGTLKFPLTERGGPCRGMAQSPVLVIGPLLFFFFFFSRASYASVFSWIPAFVHPITPLLSPIAPLSVATSPRSDDRVRPLTG